MLEQCCNHSKQCRNNDATLCYAKNRRCESSRVTPPVDSRTRTTTNARLDLTFFAYSQNKDFPESFILPFSLEKLAVVHVSLNCYL